MLKQKQTKNYLGNPKLKTAGVRFEFTSEQVEELLRCKNDPIYFAEHYVKVMTIDSGLVLIKLHPFQKKIIEEFYKHNEIIVRSGRQSGKTTAIWVAFLHYIIFFNDKRLGCFAHQHGKAKDFLRELKRAYENLPMWMQQGVLEWNKQRIELENGSSVFAAACGGTTATGFTFNVVYLDEFAKVRDTIVEDFMESVFPTLSSGKSGKTIITSTPQGYNHFYRFWSEAIAGRNGYIPIDVDWRDIPGRDDAWKEKTLKAMNNNVRRFAQEYESKFLGSQNSLIEPGLLGENDATPPQEVRGEFLRIFEMPQRDRHYVVAVDTSEGKGLDYSAASVFDITELPYRQVAVFHSNKISHHEYPEYLANIIKAYNDAPALVENNSIGAEVAHRLVYEHDCYLVSPKDGEPGIRTTKLTKRLGCANLKDMIEFNKLVVKDVDTIKELSNFARVRGSWAASSGHDDLVMCLVMLAWAVDQPFFGMISNGKEADVFRNNAQSKQPLLPILDIGIEKKPTTVNFEDVKMEMSNLVKQHGEGFMKWLCS